MERCPCKLARHGMGKPSLKCARVRRFFSSTFVIFVLILIIIILGVALPTGIYLADMDERAVQGNFNSVAAHISSEMFYSASAEFDHFDHAARVLTIFCGPPSEFMGVLHFADHELGEGSPISVIYAPVVGLEDVASFRDYVNSTLQLQLSEEFDGEDMLVAPNIDIFPKGAAPAPIRDLLKDELLGPLISKTLLTSSAQLSPFLHTSGKLKSNATHMADAHVHENSSVTTWISLPIRSWRGSCWLARDDPTWRSKVHGTICGVLLLNFSPFEILQHALEQISPAPINTLLYDHTLNVSTRLSAIFVDDEWKVGELPPDIPIISSISRNVSVAGTNWTLVLNRQPGFVLRTGEIAIFCAILVGVGSLLACIFTLFLRRHRLALTVRDQERVRRNNLIAFVSHEIRNVLQAIASVQDILLVRADEAGDKATASLLGDVNMVTNIGVTLLNDLLDLSRVEASVLQLDLKPVEFRVWLKSVLSVISGLVKPGVVFSYTVETSVPKWLLADSPRLAQILSNVLLNSFKFTLKGSVVMTVKHAKGTLRDNLITFEVADTGKGISEEWQQKLMRPYAQEHEGAAGAPNGGTGLGLALCKVLCEKMDGTLRLTSQGIGKGSTTLVEVQLASCLPLAETPSPFVTRRTSGIELASYEQDARFTGLENLKNNSNHSKSSKNNSNHSNSNYNNTGGNNNNNNAFLQTNAPAETVLRRLSAKNSGTNSFNITLPPAWCNSSSSSNSNTENKAVEEKELPPLVYRALVVDDSALNRRLLAHMISSFFNVVDQAANGQEAFELAMAAERANAPYDAVVTDQEMPVMTGVESLQLMIKYEVQAKLVMVCGNPDSVRELLSPTDDVTVMVKPVRKEDFASVVFPSVMRRRKRRELRHLHEHSVELDPSYYGDGSRRSARLVEPVRLEHGTSTSNIVAPCPTIHSASPQSGSSNFHASSAKRKSIPVSETTTLLSLSVSPASTPPAAPVKPVNIHIE